ncbi:MAG: rRNA maturation RNase YbeY [Chloroflexi bacterium]|nr:rRNA maturation RNase YbeY [Chloroflexota bacterium]
MSSSVLALIPGLIAVPGYAIMPTMQISVLVDPGAECCPPADWLRQTVRDTLRGLGASDNLEIGLVITTQEEIRKLNRRYRKKDRPTDVLAFFMTEEAPTPDHAFVTAPDGVLHLGEVIISCPQAVIQAGEHGHSLERELAVLIIHGVLHLAGFDHTGLAMRRAMESREKEILTYLESKGQVEAAR